MTNASADNYRWTAGLYRRDSETSLDFLSGATGAYVLSGVGHADRNNATTGASDNRHTAEPDGSRKGGLKIMAPQILKTVALTGALVAAFVAATPEIASAQPPQFQPGRPELIDPNSPERLLTDEATADSTPRFRPGRPELVDPTGPQPGPEEQSADAQTTAFTPSRPHLVDPVCPRGMYRVR